MGLRDWVSRVLARSGVGRSGAFGFRALWRDCFSGVWARLSQKGLGQAKKRKSNFLDVGPSGIRSNLYKIG